MLGCSLVEYYGGQLILFETQQIGSAAAVIFQVQFAVSAFHYFPIFIQFIPRGEGRIEFEVKFLFAVIGAFAIGPCDGNSVFPRGNSSIGKGEVVVAEAAGFIGSVV